MRKYFQISCLIFVSVLFVTGCDEKEQICHESIRITRIHQHPILVDHGRKLVIAKRIGFVLDEQELYGDPGEGCNAYLFDDKKKQQYILIDCNGQWLSISKESGKINTMGWLWEEEFPEYYVGTFNRAAGEWDYDLVKEEKLTKGMVYKFKDPLIK